jgi:hypothetical protein
MMTITNQGMALHLHFYHELEGALQHLECEASCDDPQQGNKDIPIGNWYLERGSSWPEQSSILERGYIYYTIVAVYDWYREAIVHFFACALIRKVCMLNDLMGLISVCTLSLNNE